VPKLLSLPQLKVYNINRNADIRSVSLGFCPLLEVFAATYCAISEMGSFMGCQSLRELDVSYNEIASLTYLLQNLKFNNPYALQVLCFNENVFNHVPDE